MHTPNYDQCIFLRSQTCVYKHVVDANVYFDVYRRDGRPLKNSATLKRLGNALTDCNPVIHLHNKSNTFQVLCKYKLYIYGFSIPLRETWENQIFLFCPSSSAVVYRFNRIWSIEVNDLRVLKHCKSIIFPIQRSNMFSNHRRIN